MSMIYFSHSHYQNRYQVSYHTDEVNNSKKTKRKFFQSKTNKQHQRVKNGIVGTSIYTWGGVFSKLITLYSCGVLCVCTCLKHTCAHGPNGHSILW